MTENASRRKSHSVSTSLQSIQQKQLNESDQQYTQELILPPVKEEENIKIESTEAEKEINELKAAEFDEILDSQDMTKRPPSPSLSLLNQLERTDLAPELDSVQAPIPPPPPIPHSLV